MKCLFVGGVSDVGLIIALLSFCPGEKTVEAKLWDKYHLLKPLGNRKFWSEEN